MKYRTRISIDDRTGIRIRELPAASLFFRAGMRPGDTVLAVNGEKVIDELDFRFKAAASPLHIDFMRNGRKRTIAVEREPGTFLDLSFYEKPIRRCANRCIFCFIDQMPGGLRKRLYIKDEDLSHSFLNGNYVTLTNATKSVLERIVATGLSPLFVSVHATDPVIRNRMLGIKRASLIMEQLSYLTYNGIDFHTQIVVCPGYNDGPVLRQTIKGLMSLGKNLLSIAVVPVGLTRFRTFPLSSVSPSNSRAICTIVKAMSDRDKARTGKRRLFCADELFLRAGDPIPAASYYEEYPQIENGVGLLRQLEDSWQQAKKRARRMRSNRKHPPATGKKYLLLTSMSAYPFLQAIALEVQKLQNVTLHVEPVGNRFFGETITVAGLLTAQDIVRSIRTATKQEHYSAALLPAAMFNYAGFTLDGYSTRRISRSAGITIKPIGSIDELLAL
jgi:putative radical SAM enzyme (TIGR03279 family)